ncbi:hypothetical protein BS78_08G027000 [Paspalum vaginatum]|nr:hypothetical protein BS78_08G027000 [Paspalum vaginatum]
MYSDGRRPPPVIAVDLGNTNSCAAGYGPGNDDAMFRFCIPSWVAFADNGTVLVGEAAKNHAHADPGNAIFGFKRLLGLRRNYMDEEETVQRLIDRVPYKIGPRNAVRPIVQIKSRDDDGGAVKQEFDVEELASLLIGELKRKAEDHLGRKVRRAVMAVPQHFHGPSTRAAVDAAQIAGLDVVRTVSDPVAAAAAYGLRRKKTLLREGGAALVLHVGGGTAAATVLTPVDGYLEALAHRDDPFLGGDDFDRRVVDHFVGLIEAEHGVDVGHDRVALGKLRAACERAKKALSSQDHARVSVESLFAGGVGFSETLSRSDFEALN